MKTSLAKASLTAILCLSLTASTFDPPPAEAQVAGGVMILVAVAIASCIIIKAMSRPNGAYDRVLVLEMARFDGNWIPVATNFHAFLNPQNPVAIFAPQMTEDVAQYRVKDITNEYRAQHPTP